MQGAHCGEFLVTQIHLYRRSDYVCPLRDSYVWESPVRMLASSYMVLASLGVFLAKAPVIERCRGLCKRWFSS